MPRSGLSSTQLADASVTQIIDDKSSKINKLINNISSYLTPTSGPENYDLPKRLVGTVREEEMGVFKDRSATNTVVSSPSACRLIANISHSY